MLKAKVKKVMLGTCSAALVLCAAIGVSKMQGEPISTNADSNVIKMVNGAQIRLTPNAQTSGVGFVSIVNLEQYEALETETATVTTGTLMATKLALDGAGLNSAEGFTHAKIAEYNNTPANASKQVKNADIVNVGWIDESTLPGVTLAEGEVAFRGSVVDLTTKNAERTYCARGYVAVTVGEETAYTYTDYAEVNNARSVQQVAYTLQGNAEVSNDIKTYAAPFAPAAYETVSATLFDASEGSEDKIFNMATNSEEKLLLNETAVEGLNFRGGYEGKAIKISKPANNGKYYTFAPQVYKENFKTDYAKIGFWYAFKKIGEEHTNDVSLVLDANMQSLAGTKTLTEDDFGVWHYVECDVSKLDNAMKDGRIHLFDVWSSGTVTYRDNLEVYVGEVKLLTENDLLLMKGDVLNGVTDRNYTQYQYGSTIKGDIIQANTYQLDGGYTGKAVEFALSTGSPYGVDLPQSLLPTDTTNKYFSMWFAIRTNETGAAITGNQYVTFQRPVTNKLYSENFTATSGGASTANVTYAPGTTYQVDTWYQLVVPVSSITTDMYLTDSDYLSLFQITSNLAATDLSKYNVLIGDIGIVDVTTPEGYMLKVNAIEGASKMTTDVKGTYVSAEDVQALGFNNDKGYNGAAIAFAKSNNNYKLSFSQADYDKYTNEANGYKTIRIWYAASTTDTVTFMKGKSNSLWNATGNKDATKGAWDYLEIDISALTNTGDNPTYVNGGVILFNVWCTGTPTLYLGDVQFLK